MTYEPVTIREAAQMEVLLFVGLAFVGALAIIFWGFQTYQFGRLIRDTAPEPVSSVAMGRTELDGDAVPAETVFDQPFSEGQCVYAEFKVREYEESDDDDEDDSWETVQSGTRSAPFYIDDGTGRMLVEPNDDTIYELSDAWSTEIRVGRSESPPPVVQEFLGNGGGVPPTSDVDHVTRGEIGSVGSTNQKRRYKQTVVPINEETYVFGGATHRDPEEMGPDDDQVILSTDPGTQEFIISDKGEFELASFYRNRSIVYIAGGLIAGAMILAVLAQILITGPVFGIDLTLP